MFEVRKKNQIENENLNFVILFGMMQNSKTGFSFVPARTVSEFYSFKGENITFYSMSNQSTANVIRVRVFPSFGPFFLGFTVALAP